jgi:hypothetical protein
MSTGNSDPGGWCTNWAAYDVPTLWNMLQAEDVVTTSQHVTAWRETHELLSLHMDELKRQRDDLAAKWPADRSPAAAAFVAYVDGMLGSMKQTSEAAVGNNGALAGINDALITAREKVGQVHEQWQKYQKNEDSSLSLFGWHPFADTPDNWQEDLKLQAAKHMSEADTVVFQNTAKLVPPAKFDPRVDIEQQQDFPADGSSGSASPGGGTAPGPGSSSGGGWMRAPVIPAPVPVSVPSPPPAMPPGGLGPVLTGGTGAAPISLPGSGPAPVVPGPGLPGLAPIGPLVPPGRVIGPGPRPMASRGGPAPGVPAGEAMPPRTFAGPGRGEGGGRVLGGPGGEPAGLRTRGPLPPGGVIGGEPAPGAVSSHSSAARSAPSVARRVNPVGGVLGERPGAAGSGGGGQFAGGLGGQRSRRRGDDSGVTFDPDNPWATEQGGPAVLEPGLEPTSHDPGPGVIGIDR